MLLNSKVIYFKLKLWVFVMTKVVSNRDICFVKAVLLLCEHKHLLLKFASHGIFCPPPLSDTIRVTQNLENNAFVLYSNIRWATIMLYCRVCNCSLHLHLVGNLGNAQIYIKLANTVQICGNFWDTQ